MVDRVLPATCPLGPPAPGWLQWLARSLMLGVLIVVSHWVQADLGGVAAHPSPPAQPGGPNDTGKLFNWHPVLMCLAFAVFMGEALLTYAAPLLPGAPRPVRKAIHASLHTAAALCALLGLLAAYLSHSLKLPSPIPNFYSPHSWLGLATLSFFALQYGVGLGAYLWPQAPLPVRLALGPLHKFGGKMVWLAGLASMATGLQEKVTFLQMGKGLGGEALYTGIIRLPALAQLLLLLLAATVLYHQVPPAKPLEDDREARQSLLHTGAQSVHHAGGLQDGEA